MAETDSDQEKTVLTVPKFSSFKSKEPPREPKRLERCREPPREPPRESPPRKRRADDDSQTHRSERHHKSRHSSNDEPRRRRERRSPSPDRRATRDSKPRPGQPASMSSRGVPGLFVIDTKGDPLITQYGGIDKSQIPAYHRHGGGRVLGTPGRLVIHHDHARDQFSLRMPGDGSALFAEGDGLRARKPFIRPDPIRIRPRKGGLHLETGNDSPEDFIPLSSSRRRKRQRSEDSSDDNDDEHPNYRSIHGKAKPRHLEDSESDSDSDTSIDMTITAHNNPLKWKSLQLSKQVKEHPEDIAAWIELVDHQDALLKAGEDIDHSVLEDEAHSFAEIKVSMLEKALRHTSHSDDRRRVLVYLMREGGKVWSGKAATKRWAQVLQDEDGHFELWKAHFDFFASNITTFRFNEGKKLLLDRLRRLLARVADPNFTREAAFEFEEAVHVFLLATRFVHDAGYKELAVAAWQGLLELNLFRSQTMADHMQQAALEAFQEFWESEVPRIGDAEAKGWRQFVEGGGVGDPPEPERSDAPEPLASRDAYKAWCHLEQTHAQRARMPARTMDDGTEDDPFRVVMFTDIEPFLFLIPGPLLPGLLEQLVDAFLLFSGFQPAFKSSPWTRAALRDPLISSALVDVDMDMDVNPEAAAPTDDFESATPRKEPDFAIENIHAAISPWVLFGDAKWFRYVVQRRSAPVDVGWMTETLRQVVHAAGMEPLAPYYMALRFSADPSTTKQTAKALLKRFPTNAHVFNAYALAAFANNEPAVANKVLISTIEAASLSTPWSRFLLCTSWSWIELHHGTKQAAALRLCSSVEPALRTAQPGAELTRTTMLKAQQAFTSQFDELLAGGDLEGASCLAECLMLLSYLTAEGSSEPTSAAQGNIAAAMRVAEAVSRDFSTRGLSHSLAHERALQFAAQLLYLNASKGPFRRVFMRDQLSLLIALFPQNTIFLALFEWSDASLRVIDETRGMLYQSPLSQAHDCISTRVFAIRHELARGNANSARSAFEQALASDACRRGAGLWVVYIRFCRARGRAAGAMGNGKKREKGRGRDKGKEKDRDRDIDKAKEVFYRAVRHCPGSKGVVMEAFGTLVGEMAGEELRGVFEQMSGKGMRVHVDLEEFLERRG